MEQLAETRSIYLTEHTAKLVGGYFALRDLGESRIKGASEPLHVFELEGVGTLRTRLDVSRARGLLLALRRPAGGDGHLGGGADADARRTGAGRRCGGSGRYGEEPAL
jgi:class 3 adenylate cyclase